MSARVYGGPSHWRANLDELTLGAAQLHQATAQTMRLATETASAGGVLAGVTIFTPQGPLVGAQTARITAGLLAMRAEVEGLTRGVEFAVTSYLEAESQITNLITAAATPSALVLSLLGVTTDLNVSNDIYEIAVRGTTQVLWAPIETAATVLDRSVPGAKMVMGHTVSWMFGLDDYLWDVPATQRTYGMLAHTLQQFGLTQLAPYDVANMTPHAGADGWQPRDPIGRQGSGQAMQLLHDYAYEADTITVAKIGQPDGSDAYAVVYSGTTPLGDDDGGPLGLLAQDAAFGATGVVESVAADSVHVESATMEILAKAGVPAGATVIPMGYSQGGTHALNVALSEKVKSKYAVTDVLTVAAPTGHRTTEDLSTNMVHIEHEHDKVTSLTGASNEARLNRTTIEVQGYPDEEVNAGIFGPEHNFALIDQQLSTALQDPQVAQAVEAPLGKLEQHMTGPVAVQQFHLTRQDATPVQHPVTGMRAAATTDHATAPPRQLISIRPVHEWLTGARR